MAKYNVFESTNMRSTHFAERIWDAVYTEDVENGTFGYLDGIADGESVIYNFVPGYKSGADIVVVDQPAWDEDTCKITNQRRDKFICEAGTPFRVRGLKKGDEFGTAIEGVTSDTQSVVTDVTDYTATDVYVTIDESTGKLVASTTAGTDVVFEGRIMRKRIVGGTLVTAAHSYGYATNLYEIKVTTLA